MMQHVATLKTELASSSFALENAMGVSDAATKGFGVLKDQHSDLNSNQRVAFEDAMKQAKNNTERRQDQKNDVVRDRQNEQVQRRQEEQIEAQNKARTEQQQSAEQAQQRRQDIDAKRESQQELNQRRAEKAQESKTASDSKNKAIEKANSADEESKRQNSEKRVELTDKQKTVEELTSFPSSVGKPEIETETEFDMVEYINQVRLLNADKNIATQAEELDLPAISNDLFSQFIIDQNKELDLENPSEPILVDENSDFVKIHLTQEDMQALLKQEGISLDAQGLSDKERLVILDEAIAKVLSEFDGNKPQTTENLNVKNDLDAELLKAMLVTSKDSGESTKANDLVAASAISEKNIENDVIRKSPSMLNDLAQLATDSDKQGDAELVNSSNLAGNVSGSTNVDASMKKPVLAEQSLSINSINAERGQKASTDLTQQTLEEVDVSVNESVGLVDKQVTNSALKEPVIVDVPKKTANKQGIELLAKLPEEKLESALDNINKRVSEVVTDLKAEAKGSEFIAALQAGVKEIKEQLKQGREPGIDLKSLVTESLAKADIPLPQSQNEAKLDKQVSQFSNILGAANSITQSTSQALNASLSLNEVNLQKETNQAQVESAKQLQQQSGNNEKAFNILKPEGQTQLAEKVRWMVNNRSLTAEIRLDPPDLGGMQIKVAMSGDAASVNFTVQSQHARDVLDQATSQLRDMLEEQGIALGESNVQQESSQSQQQFAEQNNFGTGSANKPLDTNKESQNSDLAEQDLVSENRIVNGRIGGIDHYA